ncbi:hypothetical protein CDAR_22151 [Caerostris darwini]|uniref:Uncharacterized protein n=1 Tax=Caerostris darwini TaxID=1538125 RepID=A0AAV4USR7_9ARAC|nr:hypothetical protein CDAR_22151 [Caerostris darwini]
MTSPITTTPQMRYPPRSHHIIDAIAFHPHPTPGPLTTIHTPKHNKHFIRFEESQLIQNHALHLIQHRFPLQLSCWRPIKKPILPPSWQPRRSGVALADEDGRRKQDVSLP